MFRWRNTSLKYLHILRGDVQGHRNCLRLIFLKKVAIVFNENDWIKIKMSIFVSSFHFRRIVQLIGLPPFSVLRLIVALASLHLQDWDPLFECPLLCLTIPLKREFLWRIVKVSRAILCKLPDAKLSTQSINSSSRLGALDYPIRLLFGVLRWQWLNQGECK